MIFPALSVPCKNFNVDLCDYLYYFIDYFILFFIAQIEKKKLKTVNYELYSVELVSGYLKTFPNKSAGPSIDKAGWRKTAIMELLLSDDAKGKNLEVIPLWVWAGLAKPLLPSMSTTTARCKTGLIWKHGSMFHKISMF